MLSTDIQNADAQLSVRFFDGTVRSEYKTAQEGRPVVEDVVFVEVAVPGNNLQVLQEIAHDGHKRRFPLQWQHYMNTKGDALMSGTPIDELTFLSPAARENLKAMKFYSVEQIANAADAEMQRFGMSLGMAGLALREKAIRYLQFSDKNADFSKMERELADRDTKLAAMEAQMQAMAETMERLASQTEKRGPGRPPKQEAEAA